MKPQFASGLLTAVFLAAVVAILLSFGYNPPDPPIPEEGVEVDVGDSDYGYSSDTDPAASSYAPPAAQGQVATQSTEASTPMPSSPTKGNVTHPATPSQPQVESKEPELNPNALFPGMRNNKGGTGSQGTSSGTGDQGKPDGTVNGSIGGGGGEGVSYSLKGRSAVSLPKPKYESNVQGKVVIRIRVDRSGRVVHAEFQPKGSSVPGGKLVEQAREAAMKARFNAVSGNAAEEQTGTIEYIFKI